MPSNRLPYFRFDVQSYLTDPSVLAMDADAEGCYIRLLAHMWQSPTPGSVASRLVPEMSGLHRITNELAPDTHQGFIDSPGGNSSRRREAVLDQIAACFDTESDAGIWHQRRMTAEWRRVQSDTKSRRNGAAITNDRRWGKVAERPLSDRLAVGNLEVEVEVEESTSTHLPAKKRAGDGDSPAANLKKEWLEAFTESFYPQYPRKVKPDDARKAWCQMKPWSQDNCDAIYNGLMRWKTYWLENETPKDKVPYPASFLRSGQWRGEPQ